MENGKRGSNLALFGAVAALMGLFGTGCGALSAAGNPKVAWALGDPATMTVVVRRADVAEDTAKHVDRLLLATPLDDDAAWLKATAPSPEDAKKQAEDIAKRDMYATTGARVVPAEVWSQSLGGVAKVKTTLTAAEISAPARSASAPSKPGKKSPSKKKEPASPTPPPGATPKYPSLLGALDPSLVDAYAAVMAKKRTIGETLAQISAEETALDQKGLTDADKKAHKDKIAELEKSADAARAEAKQLEKTVVAAAGVSSAKAPPETRDRFGLAFVNLRQAVEDASISNGAAALRYPLALPTLPQALEEKVHVFVADVIEEKTGTRPDTHGLQPGVSLDGGKVQITLNGLTGDDVAKVPIGELTTETVKRTQAWVSHALGLLGQVESTKEVLELERDMLDAVVGGFKSGGWTPPPSPVIPVVTPPPPPRPAKAQGRKAA